MKEPPLHDHDYEAWSYRQFSLAVEDERDVDSIPGESTDYFYARRACESAADLAKWRTRRNESER